MSLFGSMMNDFDEDPFFGAHMRQMRHMNNMMNSLFSDPFGMMGMAGPMSLMEVHHPRNSMMPYMPQMNMNRLLTGGLDNGLMNGSCNSFSSSTVVMSNLDGRPQVYSATSSTKVGPGGIKETRSTVQDSRTGTKKMSIGHHIHDRAHVIEREQNTRSGDLEERQEYINIEEEEADEFNREFEIRSGGASGGGRRRLPPSPRPPAPLLAIAAPPTSSHHTHPAHHANSGGVGVRHTYGSSHPQRSKQRPSKSHQHAPDY